MKKVALLLAEGFEEIEAVTPFDLLTRAGISVTVVGVTGKTVKSTRGLVVNAAAGFSDLGGTWNGVVLPGGMPGAANLAGSKLACDFVKRLFDEGAMVAAICAAPAVVLGPLGILEGRRATGYPGTEKDFPEGSYRNDWVVADGNLITSQGPGTASLFALEIIKHLEGYDVFEKVRTAALILP